MGGGRCSCYHTEVKPTPRFGLGWEFDKILKEDEEGTKPLYRTRNWNREKREKDKRLKKKKWYNKDGSLKYNTVLFVETTPGGELVKRLRKREADRNKNNDWRMEIVEKVGKNLKIFYKE